jgi:hypothetical protein
LAGRLPTQAKARVRAGGRAAAMPAGDDFNRQISIRTLVNAGSWEILHGGHEGTQRFLFFFVFIRVLRG